MGGVRHTSAGPATIAAPGGPGSDAPTASARPEDGEGRGPSLRSSFALRAALACLGLAVLSVLVLPSVPSYDPWSWLIWGREIAHVRLHLANGPSWKPFPMLFTAPFGRLGDAAPGLWLIVARTGGLLALVGAFRLAHRLAGAWAGALAVVALLLSRDWLSYLARGVSEPILVAFGLWAVVCHLEGRREWAFVLGVGAALIRPEVWPFLGIYALWLWFAAPHRGRWFAGPRRGRWLLVGGVALVALLWFVPPWIAAGDPFASGSHTQAAVGHPRSHPALTVLQRGEALLFLPVFLGALAAVVLAVRRRDRVTLGLALGAVAWLALVVVMTLGGYPGLGRFLVPPAALLCVLAGVGVVRFVELLPRRGLRVALGAVLLAGAVPLSLGPARALGTQIRGDKRAVRVLDQLGVAVGRAGGPRAVLRCARRSVVVNHAAQSALAWRLEVPLNDVRTALRRSGWVFSAERSASVGAVPPIVVPGARVRAVAGAGPWSVVSVRRAGARPPRRCPA